MLKGTVMFEPATGEPIITDKATAFRIAASTFNFAADGEKLRKVMAESVLVTATYRCSKLVAQPPELKIAHTYFELHSKTDRTAMRNNLDVLEALGLMTSGEKKKSLDSANKFGRSTLYAETGYDDALVSELFLKDEAARKREDCERAGRNAFKPKEVVSNTKAEFGDPWRLVVMDQASGRRASASARITAANLTISKSVSKK